MIGKKVSVFFRKRSLLLRLQQSFPYNACNFNKNKNWGFHLEDDCSFDFLYSGTSSKLGKWNFSLTKWLC